MGPLTVTLLLPLLLLLLLLAMERVERPLRRESVGEQLEAFLGSAQPDEVEAYIRDHSGQALERYGKRRRLARLLAGRGRERGTLPDQSAP